MGQRSGGGGGGRGHQWRKKLMSGGGGGTPTLFSDLKKSGSIFQTHSRGTHAYITNLNLYDNPPPPLPVVRPLSGVVVLRYIGGIEARKLNMQIR